MALQSSGQISLFDVVLEHRPNNTTVGSGLKPFSLTDYNSYSTSVSSPLTLSEFYSTSSSYNTGRYDLTAGAGPVSFSWAASVGDIKEIYLYTNNYTGEPGSDASLGIALTNGGTYKLRYHAPSGGSGANWSLGHGPSNFITSSAPGVGNTYSHGFFGPFTASPVSFSINSGYSDLMYLYARIIRIA